MCSIVSKTYVKKIVLGGPKYSYLGLKKSTWVCLFIARDLRHFIAKVRPRIPHEKFT